MLLPPPARCCHLVLVLKLRLHLQMLDEYEQYEKRFKSELLDRVKSKGGEIDLGEGLCPL